MIRRALAVVVAGAALFTGASVATVGPAGAREQPPPVTSILVVGDSIALSMSEPLQRAAAARGIEVYTAARNGCGVIQGQPINPDGSPYVDIIQDTRTCEATTAAAQDQVIAEHDPDVVLWMTGWESWPDRIIDGVRYKFGTIAGNEAVYAAIDETARRLASQGARIVMAPVAPNAYPSVRGLPNFAGDVSKRQLEHLLVRYAREHADFVSIFDLPGLLCTGEQDCPADIGGGVRPRNLDGFHFDGAGADWVADKLLAAIVAPPPAPPAPEVPSCVAASVGAPVSVGGCDE